MDSPIVKTSSNQDPLIGYADPLYYCRQHPHVQNIHQEEIKHHIQYSREHIGG